MALRFTWNKLINEVQNTFSAYSVILDQLSSHTIMPHLLVSAHAFLLFTPLLKKWCFDSRVQKNSHMLNS